LSLSSLRLHDSVKFTDAVDIEGVWAFSGG
jgi:hypothetical protein